MATAHTRRADCGVRTQRTPSDDLFELREGRDGQFEVGGDALASPVSGHLPRLRPRPAAMEFFISMQVE